MATPARRLALEILVSLEQVRRPLADLLAAPAAESLPARERAFLHQLVLGSLRARGRLDHALAPLLARPLEATDPIVRAALRLGAHQILDLRVPERAAVHESVALVRERRPRSAGFVNAVLRRLARDGARPLPDPEREPLAWLTSGGSLPEWLAERWLAQLGAPRATARARALLAEPAAAFRVNPRRADAERRLADAGVESRQTPIPGALVARGGLSGLAREGLVYVQDAGSQLVARLAAELAPARARVLDACAAPGGKALLIADALGAAGLLVAAEPAPARLATLRALAQRWGVDRVRLIAADAAHPPFADTSFELILVDAPCSGLGTLARHPDIRWRAQASELPRQAQRQRGLLEGVLRLLAPKGVLVYAVCSLEPEETLGVAGRFGADHPELGAPPLPAWCERFRDGRFVALLPERDGGDGFFVAPFRRR